MYYKLPKNLKVRAYVKNYDEIIKDKDLEIIQLKNIIRDTIEFINGEIEEYNKNIFVTQDMNIYVDGMVRAYQNCLKRLGDKENE